LPAKTVVRIKAWKGENDATVRIYSAKGGHEVYKGGDGTCNRDWILTVPRATLERARFGDSPAP